MMPKRKPPEKEKDNIKINALVLALPVNAFLPNRTYQHAEVEPTIHGSTLKQRSKRFPKTVIWKMPLLSVPYYLR